MISRHIEEGRNLDWGFADAQAKSKLEHSTSEASLPLQIIQGNNENVRLQTQSPTNSRRISKTESQQTKIPTIFQNSASQRKIEEIKSEKKEKALQDPLGILNKILDNKKNAASLKKITNELNKLNNYWHSTIPPNNLQILMVLGVNSEKAAIQMLLWDGLSAHHSLGDPTDPNLLGRYHTLKVLESWAIISKELSEFNEFKNIYRGIKTEEIKREFIFTVIFPVLLDPRKLGFNFEVNKNNQALLKVIENLTKLISRIQEDDNIETYKLNTILTKIIKNIS